MKVYSSARAQRKTMVLNQTLRINLESLSQLLRNQTSQSLSLTPSLQSLDAEAEALSLASQFVGALNDPYKAMLLYPLILDCHLAYPPDPLFRQTTLPTELHPLLSLYLHRCSGYSQVESQGRRMVDLFYQYVCSEAREVLQDWIQRKQSQSLGQWFFNQCVAGFFQLIFRDKKDYTVFITHFLREGLAYLFLSAVHGLKHTSPPQVDAPTIERIRVSFIGKYRLESR